MSSDAAGESVRAADALDLVRRAVGGELSRDALAATLRGWVFAPRRRVYASEPQEFFTPDSLDAVDVAYFNFGLLTDDEYLAIIRTATVRQQADIRPPDRPERG